MDRQDAKPSRPSLIAGADKRPAAAAPARILADMQNRRPAAAVAARSHRGWLWRGLGLTVIVALGAWWAWTPGSTDMPSVQVVRTGATSMADAPQVSAARIVDAAPAVPSLPAGMFNANGEAGAGTGSAPLVDPFAAVVARAEPAVVPSSPATAPSRARARGRAPSGDQQDLLSTLLHNIESSKVTAAAEAATLDALVRRLREQETPATTRRRSEQIQSNLRDCPPPNTTAGLQCRQEICAVYAGRDPACPALN